MRRRRGSILLEGVAALLLVVTSLALALDMVRRSQLEVVLQHGAFRYVRGHIHGQSAVEKRRALGEWFRDSLGRLPPVDAGLVDANRGWRSRLHLRYPQLLPFPGKHHFEVTKTCLFP